MAQSPTKGSLETDDDYKPSFKGEEMVLTFLFGVLLAGVLGVLVLDYRTLTGATIPFDSPFTRSTETSTPILPARKNDQIRRYSPQTRVDFGPEGKPKLPGVPGRADGLLSGTMTFHVGGKGIVSAVGFIEAGTAIRFEEFIADQSENSRIKTVYLHSPGGSVRDAIEMARFIRESKMNTVITKHGYCASSCPLVFSGGLKRTIKNPAALGVHQVFTSDSAIGTLQQGIANAQAISAEAQLLLVEMGVDPKAWIKAMETPKDKVYLFTEKEIKDLSWTAR